MELKCPGCGRPEVHKMCPAWGTPMYMSGALFTKEHEVQFYEERQKRLRELLSNRKAMRIEDMEPKGVIVAIGNVADGMVFVGPFMDDTAAADWAMFCHVDEEYVLVPVWSPDQAERMGGIPFEGKNLRPGQ